MTGKDEARIAELVPAILRDAGLPVPRSIVRERLGVANHVYRVDDRLTVRIGTGSDGPQFPKAAAILAAIEGESIGQTLLHTDLTRTRYPYNVMVCERLDGRPLSEVWPSLDTDGKKRHVEQIAVLLRRLHRFGAAEVPFFADVGAWPDRARERIESYLAAARREAAFPAERLDRVEDRVRAALPALDHAPEARLVHLDLHWQNVVVNEGRVVGLVDFDDADVAPPEFDVWSLMHALAEDVPPATAIGWLRELFPEVFSAPGHAGRFVLDQIQEMLWGLTQAEGETWITVAEAREESESAYRRLFESDFYEPWFRAFQGR